MIHIPIYKLDAFTDSLFNGNPAAVCILDNWLSEPEMQNIAAENNLSETAFVVKDDDLFYIRWFTPTVEVDLCGHATLASAYVLFNELNYSGDEIRFVSPRSGILNVLQKKNKLYLDFPADTLEVLADYHDIIKNCIDIKPIEVYKGMTDYLAVLATETEVSSITPNLYNIASLNARGLIVTAKGDNCDFVSRFFAPQVGINEDPATGSAHTSLTPYWHSKMGKTEFTAKQLSERGGFFNCIYENERIIIGGDTKLYLKGEILL